MKQPTKQKLILKTSKFLFNFFTKIEIIGKENIPENGSVLLVMNHFSIFDVVMLVSHITPKLPIFFADSKLHDTFYGGPILRAFPNNYINVHRGKFDRDVLRQGLDLLSQDEIAIIFPEGGIDEILRPMIFDNVDPENFSYGMYSRRLGQVIDARPGTAYLAAKAGTPILPVGAAGIEKMTRNALRLRRTKITVRIGETFELASLDGLNRTERKQRLKADSDKIMIEIAQLLPPQNRGIYRQQAKAKLATNACHKRTESTVPQA